MAYVRAGRQGQPAQRQAPRRGAPGAGYRVTVAHRHGGHEALMRGRGIASAVALIAACSNEPAGVRPPAIDAAAVAASPSNVLSAVVAVGVRSADSVRVRYGLEGSPLDSTTAAVVPQADAAAVPVLGLLPDTRYALRVIAYGNEQEVAGEALSFVTGTLPADLPQYVASGSSPSPGYVVFAAALYGLVIDNTRPVVWYHLFPNGPGLNFQALATRRYAARPPTPDPTDLAPWVEIDPLGNLVRTFGCANGLQARFHDLLAASDGSYWIMCDDTRTMDLSGVGGVANAKVTGTVVQHVSGDGTLLFQWNPFDHFSIEDLPLADRTGPTVNWTHGNALDLDTDGNLVVSFRSLNETTRLPSVSRSRA